MNFADWLVMVLSSGIVAVVVKLFFDVRYSKYDKDVFKSNTKSGQENIDEKYKNMSTDDLESSAKSVDRTIRNTTKR